MRKDGSNSAPVGSTGGPPPEGGGRSQRVDSWTSGRSSGRDHQTADAFHPLMYSPRCAKRQCAADKYAGVNSGTKSGRDEYETQGGSHLLREGPGQDARAVRVAAK